MSQHLLAPITLRDLTVRNRIWVPPMCQYSVAAGDGVATDYHLMHYGSFARGGAGAVILEATGVVPEGRISPQDLGLWDDAQREALRPIVDLIHSFGAAAGIQLAHAGRKASTEPEWGTPHPGASLAGADGGWETVAPSAIAYDQLTEPTALDEAGIDEVVEAFAASAVRAVEAGFDMIEIHAAHGYLLHQFLSPLSNQRADEYGGTLANRARLLLRIIDEVRAVAGDGVPVFVRISATDHADGGFTPEEAAQVAEWAIEHGADLIDVSSGGLVAHQRIDVHPGYQVPLAATVRRSGRVPVSAVGLITAAEQAEQVLSEGAADAVFAGREWLRDPHFGLRAAHELGAETDWPPQYLRARWR